jgi:hypothetical protein
MVGLANDWPTRRYEPSHAMALRPASTSPAVLLTNQAAMPIATM